MQKLSFIKLFTLLSFLFFAATSSAQNPQNWTSKQLMQPSELANDINAKKDIPVIISVGPGAPIPNSIDIGLVNNKEGLDKLKNELNSLAKDKKVVVYCGCCPYEHCPNVRPAISTLKSMNFTNYYLLDLPNNIKKDWIEKGYPVSLP
jgi:thiosulfate/3-mercaptopyruvate sulfurtransferase